ESGTQPVGPPVIGVWHGRPPWLLIAAAGVRPGHPCGSSYSKRSPSRLPARYDPGMPRREDHRTWIGAVAAVFVIAWLAIGGFGGAKVGELASVASNDSADYLPTSSEAAR